MPAANQPDNQWFPEKTRFSERAKSILRITSSVLLRIISTICLICIVTGFIIGLYTFVLHFQGKVNIWDLIKECIEILRSYI